jgi:phytoene synthase
LATARQKAVSKARASLYGGGMSDLCAATVRHHDRDRFVLSLLAPPSARPALWALYAFNYEVARTRETVTDPPLGRIRLQWWREALDEALRPDAPQYHHEILRILAPYAHAYGLPAEEFHALIDAREADMTPGAVSGLPALADYAAATNLPLLRLGVRICGEDAQAPYLRPVATAYGLTGLLRAHAAHTHQGGFVADAAAVRSRAETLLAGAGRPGGLAGAHAALARLCLRRLGAGKGADTPAFLLWRLLLARR